MSAQNGRGMRNRSRRKLLEGLVTIPLLPHILPSRSASSSPDKTSVVSAIQDIQPATAALSAPLTEIVRARYGKYLTPDQLEDVRKDIEGGLRASERLRSRKLMNGDEPDFVFSATNDSR